MTQKILRRPAVEDLTGLRRSTLYDMMSKGDFPRPIKLTAKAVGWREAEIAEWIEKRATADA